MATLRGHISRSWKAINLNPFFNKAIPSACVDIWLSLFFLIFTDKIDVSVAGWIALALVLLALLGEAVISGMAIHGARTVRFKSYC